MHTLTHQTKTGDIYRRQTAANYAAVRITRDRIGTDDAGMPIYRHRVVSWHGTIAAAYAAATGRDYAERINGGDYAGLNAGIVARRQSVATVATDCGDDMATATIGADCDADDAGELIAASRDYQSRMQALVAARDAVARAGVATIDDLTPATDDRQAPAREPMTGIEHDSHGYVEVTVRETLHAHRHALDAIANYRAHCDRIADIADRYARRLDHIEHIIGAYDHCELDANHALDAIAITVNGRDDTGADQNRPIGL
jgi:hypothetical protein